MLKKLSFLFSIPCSKPQKRPLLMPTPEKPLDHWEKRPASLLINILFGDETTAN